VFYEKWRFTLIALVSVTSCISVDDARTPQQKNLNTKIFETISSPVDDFLPDTDYEESQEEKEKKPVIGASFYKPISLSIADGMKIREILTQMASLAGVDIFVVQDVEGTISFSANGRPFLDVLKDVCSSLGLKYSINGNSVRVEVDSPISQIYNVQFLNIQRDTQSNVSVSTDIFANQSIGIKGNVSLSAGSANNGSNSSVSEVVKSDFWAELEAALKTIVGEKDGFYVSIHRQGGLVTVYAPSTKQDEVQKYLHLLKQTTESQVLIEAKILEVNLKNEYKNGINWNIVRSSGVKLEKTFSDPNGLFSFGIARNNLNIVAGIIEKFGAVKTLSSPRITVLNNQSAVLKVAQNEVVYFPELQRQYATVSDNRSTDVLSTTIHTIPVGLIMSVVPSVDCKDNTILLSLRPTISRIVNYKDVPFFYQTTSTINLPAGSDPTKYGIQYHKIPIVDVREMDSVLKLISGQVVVMGGLMQESSSNNRDGLPGFRKADFILGSHEKSTNITELVIFLKATILRRKSKTHHKADQKMYDTFASDPRPLEFKK
jgi:general secretion pathway protein D